MGSTGASNTEIDWTRLDKTKFLVFGAALFSGVTTALFPITVVKTRQMALDGVSAGLQGAKETAASIWRSDGLRGFYKGFGTTVVGVLPARMVYMTVLEVVKSESSRLGRQCGLSDTSVAGLSAGLAGGAASLATQAVLVPVDVVSQRLMVAQRQGPTGGGGGRGSGGGGASAPAEAPTTSAPSTSSRRGSSRSSNGSHTRGSAPGKATAPPRPSQHPVAGAAPMQVGRRHASSAARMPGLELAGQILRQEGLRGLYRGLGMSLATYAPSSAVWWSAYGTYQKLIWAYYLGVANPMVASAGAPPAHSSSSSSSNGGADGVGVPISGMPSNSTSGGGGSGGSGSGAPPVCSTHQLLVVQTVSALCAGATSAFFTNPLDLVKTRLQVAQGAAGRTATVRSVLARILADEGVAGLWRGIAPRVASATLWGTAMVTTYEFLKRVCQLPPDAASA